MIRKSYAALRNLVTSLPNPDPDPNPMLSGQVESESESEKTGSDPHHCRQDRNTDCLQEFLSYQLNTNINTLQQD